MGLVPYPLCPHNLSSDKGLGAREDQELEQTN